jgi:hypothetical protein
MLDASSTASSLDPAPTQSEDKPAKPVSSRGAMRFPGDQPKAPPSPPPRRSDAERSPGCQGTSGQQG